MISLPCEMCDLYDCITGICTVQVEPEIDEDEGTAYCEHFKEGEYF
jgi:hypothetical protein